MNAWTHRIPGSGQPSYAKPNAIASPVPTQQLLVSIAIEPTKGDRSGWIAGRMVTRLAAFLCCRGAAEEPGCGRHLITEALRPSRDRSASAVASYKCRA
jgi:hypothetical protein